MDPEEGIHCLSDRYGTRADYLENLVFSLAGKMMSEESNPISYIPSQEMRCVVHWFSGWSDPQRSRFMEDLLCKAVPGKLCLLLEGLNSLQLNAPPPSLFQCQMKLWDQWFQGWDEDERNEFLHRLEQQDPAFVGKFYQEVAGTAGQV